MSIDLKDDNIVVLAVHPGYVVTDMTQQLGEAMHSKF
jgi:NAD(P)-dependent dehydrogenase (short-subunit alcohol dehydrogenase family)